MTPTKNSAVFGTVDRAVFGAPYRVVVAAVVGVVWRTVADVVDSDLGDVLWNGVHQAKQNDAPHPGLQDFLRTTVAGGA